jgi:hypothetical protein
LRWTGRSPYFVDFPHPHFERGGIHKDSGLQSSGCRRATIEEIAEAIQQLVVDVFEKEEHILWYDTDEYGATNWSSDIVGAVDEAIAGLFESNDPREMGWVGDDGRP